MRLGGELLWFNLAGSYSLHGMEYPFGCLRSAVSSLSHPNSLCTSSLLTDGLMWEAEKFLTCVGTSQQQLKHYECCWNANSEIYHSSRKLPERKLPLSQLKPGQGYKDNGIWRCILVPEVQREVFCIIYKLMESGSLGMLSFLDMTWVWFKHGLQKRVVLLHLDMWEMSVWAWYHVV